MNFKILTTTIILFAIISQSRAQNVNQQVEHIQKVVKEIDSANFEKKLFTYNNKCGVIKATIAIYYENDSVRKITDTGLGDDDKAAAKWAYKYYYENGKLIFSSESISGADDEGKQYNNEKTEYLSSNNVVKRIENGKTIYPKKEVINSSDSRYKLTMVKSSSDIRQIYNCEN